MVFPRCTPRCALRRALRIVSLLLIVASMTGWSTRLAAGQAARVRVLISYRSPPGWAEKARVRSLGGEVRYAYHIVSALSVALPEDAVARLAAAPNVRRVEPDLQMHALEVYDQEMINAWGVARIGAGDVQVAGVTGRGVGIAIVDSGINTSHPDLRANFSGGADFVEGDGDPWDVYGHGTHVAGTACAADNGNGSADGPYGVVGVAPACDLYALKVLDDDGFGFASDLIAALEWAVDEGVSVANFSLGWDRDPGEAVADAFAAAEEAGLVMVAAACNNGNRAGKGDNVCWPAKYPSVIAVAATDDADVRATFSSTGTEVELAAPGAGVFSTWNDETGYYDPQPVCRYTDGTLDCYKYGSGTSMASPHVAGVVALMVENGVTDLNGNGRVNDEIRSRLIETAVDLGDSGWDPLYGYGFVDAVAAVGPTSPQAPVTDIAIDSISVPETALIGDPVAVTVGIANRGDEGIATPLLVTLRDVTADALIGTVTVSAPAPGTTTAVGFMWQTSGPVGLHTIEAGHELADDDVANNLATTGVMVLGEIPVPLTVTGVVPSTIGAGVTVLEVSGTGFVDGATVRFEGGKGPAPTASAAIVGDGGTRLTLDVTAKAPKTTAWDVRVTNPDGETAVLLQALTVSP